MNIEELRALCLSLPGATEDVKWEHDLAFCVGEKMFAVANLETGQTALSIKCTREKFAEMLERPGVIPAPYVARYHWIALENLDVLADQELVALVKNSYELVFKKLPASIKKKLSQS